MHYRKHNATWLAKDLGALYCAFYYHTDEQNNVRFLTDGTEDIGCIAESYAYGNWAGAFARFDGGPAQQFANDFGFPIFLDYQGTAKEVTFQKDGQVRFWDTYWDGNGYTSYAGGPAQSWTGNPFLYNGRQWDPELGMYYYRNRYMDPMTGRFISQDPLGAFGDPGNLGNPYTYTGNNPWSWTDAFGLFTDRLYDPVDGGFWYYAREIAAGALMAPTAVATFISDSVSSFFSDADPFRSVEPIGKPGLNDIYLDPNVNWEKDPRASILGSQLTETMLETATGIADSGIYVAGTMAAGKGVDAIVGRAIKPCATRVLYRYVGETEARIAEESGFVPNVTPAGDPKLVFFSTGKFQSGAAAEDALMIGQKNPIRPYSTPTHRITVDASNV